MDETFHRVETLIGAEGFKKLTDAHICIAGYGAVGSFAAEALVRSGAGHIRIIDADTYVKSNINRQLGADTETVGLSKVSIGCKRLKLINPQLDIETEETFLNDTNLSLSFKPFSDGIRPGYLIDAIDTLDAKIALLKYWHAESTHIFSSMGAARKTDPSRILAGDISKTETCPLAREVRRRLRKEGIYSGIQCIYSTEQPVNNESQQAEENSGKARGVLGSLVTVTGSFGLRIAAECIKKILSE